MSLEKHRRCCVTAQESPPLWCLGGTRWMSQLMSPCFQESAQDLQVTRPPSQRLPGPQPSRWLLNSKPLSIPAAETPDCRSPSHRRGVVIETKPGSLLGLTSPRRPGNASLSYCWPRPRQNLTPTEMDYVDGWAHVSPDSPGRPAWRPCKLTDRR